MADPDDITTALEDKVTTKPAEVSKKAASKRHKKKKRGKRKGGTSQRTRTVRPYPASSFEEALPLAEAIHEYASSEKVRRLTLLKHSI